MLLTGLKVLDTLISNAVKQCETPEGPKRIKWDAGLVKTWIRCDPDGPAEQFLTLVRSTLASHRRPISLQSSARQGSVMCYTNSLSTTILPNGHKSKNVGPSRYHFHATGGRRPLANTNIVQKLLGVAHAALQDSLAHVKKSLQIARNLENREECLEKGRRENALRKIEADRRRVKERCKKEKEARQNAPERTWGGGAVGTRTGNEVPWSSSDDSDDNSDDDSDDFDDEL